MDKTFPIQPMTKFKGFNLNITLLMVFDLVKGIIADFGEDHVGHGGVNGCYYASEVNGVLTPSCIVGQVFHRLGLLRVLIGETGETGACGMATDISEVYTNFGAWHAGVAARLASFGITVDEDASVFLGHFQARQDVSTPWGLAFEQAAQKVLDKGLVEVVETRSAIERVNAAIGQ